MKYKVGDLLLIKDCEFKCRPHIRLRLHLLPRYHLHPPLASYRRLINSFGIITKVEKHSDIFEKGSTKNDNVYVWFSQIDAKEYYFYENEVTEVEVFK
jgi:hypothetical protein